MSAWLICKVLFRLKIRGTDNIPKEGGAIIAANHSSYLDPVTLAVAAPRKVSWIVRKDVYDVWWLKWLFASTGMIRENGSVSKSMSLLDKGKIVGVFPEGTRSPDGKLGAAKRGVAVMALKTGVPVIPCSITGAYEAYPRGAILPRPFPVTVTIGKAIRFDKVEAADDTKADLSLKAIMDAIGGLMEA